MNPELRNYQSSDAGISVTNQQAVGFMSRVYRWMAFGVLITALVAHFVAITPQVFEAIFKQPIFFWGIIIAQLGMVFYLSYAINRISAGMATILYLVYSALVGLTLSVIFMVYTQQSINAAFIVTAVAFAGLSAFGYFTKRDLGPIGTFCTMALFGLIAVMVLALFIPKLMGGTMQIIIGVAGVIIFSGLTAYDTQKIKSLAYGDNQNAAISGALALYLDFINLFLSILRLFGQRK